MKVALFTDSDVFAGTERHMYDLAIALREQGVGVKVACPTPSPLAEKASAHGIDVIDIPKKGFVDFSAAGRLKSLLRSGEIDVVHAHNGRTALSAAMAVRRSGKGRCVATQHFLEPGHTAHRGAKKMLFAMAHHWVNKRTSHLIAISDAVRTEMLARQEAPAAKITMIPNGIADPDQCKLRSVQDVRQELGIGTQTPLIVCAARLEREKDIPSLVSAVAQLKHRNPSSLCVVAGEGSQQEMLQHQIESLDVARSMRLLGFRNDVLSLVRAADAFVLPSLAEPFGLAILEAMALGKPVVATRAGGPVEIVVDGQTGYLVMPSQPIKLADAIARLLDHPDAARQMGHQGRARFEERFTAARMSQATLDVYSKVLAN